MEITGTRTGHLVDALSRAYDALGLAEAVINAKIRLITRVAFGFRSPAALIALAVLNLGGHIPAPRPEMTHGSVRIFHYAGAPQVPSEYFDFRG